MWKTRSATRQVTDERPPPSDDAVDRPRQGRTNMQHTSQATDLERRQRKIDFDVLAPLTAMALVVAITAIFIAIATNGDDSAPAAAATSMTMPDGSTMSATGSTSTSSAQAPATDLKADFTMPAYDPRTEPVKAGPKTFELTASERKVKVGSKVYEMWTFNNTVPGPILRAVVGDRITIKVHNDGKSMLPHSVDMHASRMTLGGGAVQVPPGKSGSYTFTADYPGVFMYHCATAPVLHHIGMGMYGMLIVQPKDGFGAKMPEYAFVQSELYATPSDIDTQHSDALAFNGIPSQYADHPIQLPADSDVRVFMLNAGPSELSSFHVVGTIFDRVLTDGNPRNASYGRQALGIPASGSGEFEMHLTGEGQYPFVTHQFDQAAKGGVGMFITGDGKPGPGGVKDAGANGHH
jgi:nitrite reductase (NO-forming)